MIGEKCSRQRSERDLAKTYICGKVQRVIRKMFTPEIEESFSEWITDNLKDIDLTFPS